MIIVLDPKGEVGKDDKEDAGSIDCCEEVEELPLKLKRYPHDGKVSRRRNGYDWLGLQADEHEIAHVMRFLHFNRRSFLPSHDQVIRRVSIRCDPNGADLMIMRKV